MKKMILYGFWVFFYLICGFLGLIQPESSLQTAAMVVVSLLFFVPPGVLLAIAIRSGDRKTMLRLRMISILSLSLTLLFFVLNILAVGASESTGNALYYILNFVSVPMVCSRFYVLSMFLWACLLIASLPKIWKKTK